MTCGPKCSFHNTSFGHPDLKETCATTKSFVEFGDWKKNPTKAMGKNLREHIQNAIDHVRKMAQADGHEVVGKHTFSNNKTMSVFTLTVNSVDKFTLTVSKDEARFEQDNTVLGVIILSLYSTKRDQGCIIPDPVNAEVNRHVLPPGSIDALPGGAFGEGTKRSSENAVKNGFDVWMHNGKKSWEYVFQFDENDVGHSKVLFHPRNDEFKDSPSPPLVTIINRSECLEHGNKSVESLIECVDPNDYLIFSTKKYEPGFPIVIRSSPYDPVLNSEPDCVISLESVVHTVGDHPNIYLSGLSFPCIKNTLFNINLRLAAQHLNRDRDSVRGLGMLHYYVKCLNAGIMDRRAGSTPNVLVNTIAKCLLSLKKTDSIPVGVEALCFSSRKKILEYIREEEKNPKLIYIPPNSSNNYKQKADSLGYTPIEHHLHSYFESLYNIEAEFCQLMEKCPIVESSLNFLTVLQASKTIITFLTKEGIYMPNVRKGNLNFVVQDFSKYCSSPIGMLFSSNTRVAVDHRLVASGSKSIGVSNVVKYILRLLNTQVISHHLSSNSYGTLKKIHISMQVTNFIESNGFKYKMKPFSIVGDFFNTVDNGKKKKKVGTTSETVSSGRDGDGTKRAAISSFTSSFRDCKKVKCRGGHHSKPGGIVNPTMTSSEMVENTVRTINAVGSVRPPAFFKASKFNNTKSPAVDHPCTPPTPDITIDHITNVYHPSNLNPTMLPIGLKERAEEVSAFYIGLYIKLGVTPNLLMVWLPDHDVLAYNSSNIIFINLKYEFPVQRNEMDRIMTLAHELGHSTQSGHGLVWAKVYASVAYQLGTKIQVHTPVKVYAPAQTQSDRVIIDLTI